MIIISFSFLIRAWHCKSLLSNWEKRKENEANCMIATERECHANTTCMNETNITLKYDVCMMWYECVVLVIWLSSAFCFCLSAFCPLKRA